jgi:hypothetical protein
MSKINTDILKKYIVESVIKNNAQIINELNQHDISDFTVKDIVRTYKSKIKSASDLPYEITDSLWGEMADEGWGMRIEDPATLIGGVVRYFQIKDPDGESTDACFQVVTNSKDEHVIYWSFNID